MGEFGKEIPNLALRILYLCVLFRYWPHIISLVDGAPQYITQMPERIDDAIDNLGLLDYDIFNDLEIDWGISVYPILWWFCCVREMLPNFLNVVELIFIPFVTYLEFYALWRGYKYETA